MSIYRNWSLARQTRVKGKKNLTSPPYERLEQARTAKFAKYCRNKVLLSLLSFPIPSTDTQGRSVGPEEKARPKFSSTGEKAPGYRLSPEHFQTVKRMLAPDWAQKCFVWLCPIGEQRLLSSFREFAHDGYWLNYGLSRLRAVSYFSLQSYCKRNLSTQAARLLVARNQGVRLLLGSLLFAVGCDSWLIVAYPVQRTRDVVHWRSGSVNHSIEFNNTSWLNSI